MRPTVVGPALFRVLPTKPLVLLLAVPVGSSDVSDHRGTSQE